LDIHIIFALLLQKREGEESERRAKEEGKKSEKRAKGEGEESHDAPSSCLTRTYAL
jgi:hypothetical protein